MNVRGIVLTLAALVLSGCAGFGQRLSPPKPLLKPPANANEAVAIARDMADRGRWSEAMRYLDAAALSLDDQATLAKGHDRLQSEWQREKRALEDSIVVSDAENLKHKIEVLQKLTLAEPDNLVLTSRRIFWKENLANKTEALTSCAEVHVGDRPELAKRCFEVASWMPTNPAHEQRLAQVDRQLRTIESVAEKRRLANQRRERQARARVLLNNAKAAIESQDYRAALDTLDKVSALQPNNAEVVGLKEQAMSMISPQIEALIKLGDHLYLDEQLDAAVATWQAALTLKPKDEEILARIERAKTVLSKLQALRKQQKATVNKAP